MQEAINSLYVILCSVLVLSKQVGFVFLEVGATRIKNAGHIAIKQILGISVSALAFWAVGYGLVFGEGKWLGTTGWFLQLPDPGRPIPVEILFLFQFSFAAVSLAIAWGGFAERAKWSVYIIFGFFYTLLIYSVAGHWVWGEGGWLHMLGKQDFAGSTVVHLQGGIAALVASLLLKPRIGRFNRDGSPNKIQGHNQVYTVLGVFIIWLGWFGFNSGSTLTVEDGFFGYVALTTNLAAVAGALSAMMMVKLNAGKVAIDAILNGIMGALVAITAACAFVEPWAAVVIGAIAGIVSVYSVLFVERLGIDDPSHSISVHGIPGIWGTLATGLFASPQVVEKVGIGSEGLFYGGGFEQLFVQLLGVAVVALYVGAVSFALLWLMDKLVGLRVSREEEKMGLDLSEHGTISYPNFLVRIESKTKQENVF